MSTSGCSDRNVFSAINLLLASPTTLTPCSRSAALIVANSNASSLAIITRGNAVVIMNQGIAISIVKRGARLVYMIFLIASGIISITRDAEVGASLDARSAAEL